MSHQPDRMDLFDFTPEPKPKPAPASASEPAPAKRPRAAPEAEDALSVSGLTRRIRDLLEGGVGSVWVKGEVSNHRKQTSGHHYFTLKDATAQLACVLFRGNAQLNNVAPADGMEVQVFGDISVYEARGQYQMVVRRVRQAGEGALQAKFEALKRRLQAEGLFDADSKKPIPRFPRAIAIVTSPTGAALRDMLQILARRAPQVHVLVHPVRVQGAGAAGEIAAALRHLSTRPPELGPIDTVVVARGGGSLEDLWPFNEEEVARAIHACPLPVISAVGHEIDFTISDFTADLRAPTPSAAAELLAPDRAELLERVESAGRRLRARVENTLDQYRRVLDLTARGVLEREPERLLLPWRQWLDDAESGLGLAVESALRNHRETLLDQRHRMDLRRPDRLLEERAARLALLRGRLVTRAQAELEQRAADLRRRAAELRTLGPDAVLARGFSCTLDSGGRPVRDAAALKPGDEFTTRLAKGSVRGTVREVTP